MQHEASPVTSYATTAGRIAIAGVLGMGLSVACKSSRLNPDHCANREGDRTCAELYPDGSRPFCGWGTCFEAEDGCVETMPGTPDCYSPCGGERTADDEDACIDVTTATDSSMTGTSGQTSDATMGPGPGTMTGTDTGNTDPGTTGPMGCIDDDECGTGDELEAFCVDNVCTHCGMTDDPDAACASTYPGTPVCVVDQCVQCSAQNDSACQDDTPICDDDNNACIGCSDHAQCPDTACDLSTGACIQGDVFHVDGDGMPGQNGITHTSIVDAYDALNGDGVIFIHAIAGDVNYQEFLPFDQNRTVAFLAAPGENPVWQGNSANPTINVSSGTAIFHRLDLSLNGGREAVRVDDATFIAQRSRFTRNTDSGVVAQNGAVVRLENCFVAGNGTFAPAINATSSDLEIVYSTLVRGFNPDEPVIECTTPGSTLIRNSIVANEAINPGSEISCVGAMLDSTAVETSSDITTWFPNFSQGNLSLGPAGAAQFADIATWQTGDPLVDIDGMMRVGVDGMTEHAGADLP